MMAEVMELYPLAPAPTNITPEARERRKTSKALWRKNNPDKACTPLPRLVPPSRPEQR